MESSRNGCSTPGGNSDEESTITSRNAMGPRILGSPNICDEEEMEYNEKPSKFQFKKKYYFGTLNVNSLLKIGKQKELELFLQKNDIHILAVQETRFLDENVVDTQHYRIYKGKPAVRIMENMPMFGTAFYVNKRIVDSVTEFKSTSERLSMLTIKCKNKHYTLINCHAPINADNRRNLEKVNQFWDLLESEISIIPKNNVKILLGDFNAQIGKEKKFKNIVGEYPAHSRTNRNGERLINMCKMFQLKLMSTHFRKLPRKAKTWRHPNPNLGEFQLDHVAISKRYITEIMNVKVIRNGEFDSDHYLSKIKIRFIPSKTKKATKKVIRYNSSTANITKENIEKFREEIETSKKGDWHELQMKITQAAEKTLGRAKNKKKTWWNEECEEALLQRAQKWRKWRCSKKEEDFEQFRQQRKETSKIIRKIKRNFENSQLIEIQENFTKNNTRNFYQTFKQVLKGYQAPSICFKDENGKMGLNNKENCEILAKYFEKLLNCPIPTDKLEFPATPQNLEEDFPPTELEIHETIKALKNNKASGEDSITAELLKWSEPKIIKDLQLLFENIWKTEKIPVEWKTALIHPLHKKGDKQNVNNYRGVSLLPVAYKILSKILLNRVVETLDKQLGEYQGGFRKGRSCAEQIFNLKSIIRHRMLTSKPIIVSFIDFKKAFDCVDRETIDKVIREFGVKSKLANIIRETLTGTISKVKFMGEVSQSFEIKTGVRQGDGLSPLLFNCVLEKIVRIWNFELKNHKIEPITLGRKTNGIKVNCLAFADDFAILSENLTEAVIQINLLEKIANRTGLKISAEKTKFMTNIKNAPKFIETQIGKIERVSKFKYLGETIQQNGLEKSAIDVRINKMERAYGLTKNIYNKKCISRKTKLKHYTTVVRPECLYGAECLTMNYKMDKLEVLERRVIRKIMGVIKTADGWKMRSNEEVYKNIEKISDVMAKRRLTFFGHLYRMNENRLTKQILLYFWKKKSTIAWITEVKKDLERNNIQESEIAERNIFKNKILNLEGFQSRRNKKSGTTWTEERKRLHGEKMREYWKKRKQQQRKKRN